MDICENINEVKERMANAAIKSGRNINDIILVAVSKTKPAEYLLEAQRCGQNIFGENKVQEIVQKYDVVKGAQWHMIGHLQKNKVKYIIDKVKMIHSLDNLELAEEIDKRANKNNIIMPVLIQINIGREDTKSGIYEEELDSFQQKLTDYKNILVSGIMTIPPRSDNKLKTRDYFKKTKVLFDKMKEFKADNFNVKYLSMGMTADYDIAIEEGANIVRVGTGIFGARNYNINK